LADLRHRDDFLAILLMVLPNITAFYLGTGRITAFDFLQTLYRDENRKFYEHDSARRRTMPTSERSYLSNTFAILAPKVQTLELSHCWYYPISSLLMFTSLKHLSIPVDTLPRHMVG
jgi:hypothetical protein